MPAYNFKKNFAPMILSGRKPHTIRRRRKRPTVVGDRLYLYTGMRTKGCEKIAEGDCTRVDPIVIYPYQRRLEFRGVDVSGGELEILAIRDGFDSVSAFFEFFQRYDREILDDFEMIWWNPAEVTR